MADAPPTIPSWKTSFLTDQTNILSRPLVPSQAWVKANQNSQHDPPIPESILSEAMEDLNMVLQKHCRRVYPPQASRNVAEQINNLYITDAEKILASEEGGDDGRIGKESDLTNEQTIDSLPTNWPSEKQAAAHLMESNRYAEAVDQLKTLSEQRRLLQKRVDRLSKMKTLVQPLSNVGDLQENLITRNGNLEKELEKMRMLLVRVSGRVGALSSDGSGESKTVGDVVGGGKRKVDEFLTDGTVFPS